MGTTLLVALFLIVTSSSWRPQELTLTASTTLCTGYASCEAAGYSHAGYRRAGTTMFWQMYAGHNCTNYVAYRMVQSGMPNTRPWQGSGNAHNWGMALSSSTDSTPRVGAVAWWKAGVPPAGANGHVAYVEVVISSTEILVSEDYWGGDFHWRRVTKGSPGWPSGFIHLNDEGLENTQAPFIPDAPEVGRPVQAQPGEWAPSPTSLEFQWFADEVALTDQTESVYIPTPDTRGQVLSVRVTARRPGYARSTATTSTPPVALGTFEQTSPPVIEGTPEVAQQLTLQSPTWSPQPTDTAIQWYVDGEAAPGANEATWRVPDSAVDKTISASVTATSDGYRRAVATSAPTGAVLAGTIQIVEPLALRGRPTFGRTLSIRPAILAPSDAVSTYTWLRNGTPIQKASSTSYTLTRRDVGRVISVRAEYSRQSYRPADDNVQAEPTTTRPTLHVEQRRRKDGRTALVVDIRAPGARQPSGTLEISMGDTSRTMSVLGRRLRVLLPPHQPETRRLVLRFTGTHPVNSTVLRLAIDAP